MRIKIEEVEMQDMIRLLRVEEKLKSGWLAFEGPSNPIKRFFKVNFEDHVSF